MDIGQKWALLLIHIICVFDIFLHNRLVKSESSDSLLSQTSGSTRRHQHAVTARQPRAERALPVAGPSVPVLSSGTSKVTAKASSGKKRGHESKTSRQIKESRSQKHTRVKIYFLSLLVLLRKKFLYSIHLKYIAKTFTNEMKWYLYLLSNNPMQEG